MESNPVMVGYPLRFKFHDVVRGHDFLAGIVTDGRLFLREEDDGTWAAWGVTPGGLAASGPDASAALKSFRETWRSVLIDSASFASSFQGFMEEVRGYFSETCESVARDWIAAVEVVRNSADPRFENWPKRSADEDPEILVVELDDEPVDEEGDKRVVNVVSDVQYSQAA